MALAVKTAFIDRWMRVSMIIDCMQVAPTPLLFDLYGQLCLFSNNVQKPCAEGGHLSNASPKTGEIA